MASLPTTTVKGPLPPPLTACDLKKKSKPQIHTPHCPARAQAGGGVVHPGRAWR